MKELVRLKSVKNYGVIAQLVVHLNGIEKVSGSSPDDSTAESRWFESSLIVWEAG
jgi:hypothetical protein